MKVDEWLEMMKRRNNKRAEERSKETLVELQVCNRELDLMWVSEDSSPVVYARALGVKVLHEFNELVEVKRDKELLELQIMGYKRKTAQIFVDAKYMKIIDYLKMMLANRDKEQSAVLSQAIAVMARRIVLNLARKWKINIKDPKVEMLMLTKETKLLRMYDDRINPHMNQAKASRYVRR